MANTRSTTKNDEQVELNLDQKVTVKNIAGWNVGFARIDSSGDVTITADGSTKLTRNEIIAQVQNGNKLFTGLDGNGAHATLFIDDDATRQEVGFDSETNKQVVFSDSVVTGLFASKSRFETFQNKLTEAIQTRAEKYAIIQAIKRLKINDYSKIRFVEDYTGFKVQ